MSHVSFSSLRPGDIVRFSNPDHSGTAEDFTPEGEEPFENDDSTYAVSVKARVSSSYRSHNFGLVVDAVLLEGEFTPAGHNAGTPYPFYERDEWDVEVLNTPDNVLLTQHFTWQDDDGVWLIAVRVGIDVWSFNGEHISLQELKNICSQKKTFSLSRARK